ncbi:MAG: pilus assembly protein TadG-related protein [Pirellulales bacterium]
MKTRIERCARRRRGNILVLSAFLMVAMIAMIAFAVDVGYLVSARTELQRSADAAAVAGALDLVNRFNGTTATQRTATARAATATYAGYNHVTGGAPTIDTGADVQVGYVPNPFPLATRNPENLTPTETNTSQVEFFNTVLVRVRKSTNWNGRVPYFFARVWGINEAPDTYTVAVAALPPPGPSDILPITLKKETWDDLMANPGAKPDEYGVQGNTVSAGSDGIHEIRLYPEPGADTALGNWGTFDIPPGGNSASHLAGQIMNGATPGEVALMPGGQFKLGSDGTLPLTADTGKSYGIKDELAAIIGLPRVIPIYTTRVLEGNKLVYTSVQFVGIRVLEVHLTGKDQYVKIQPTGVPPMTEVPSNSTGWKGKPYEPRLFR